MELRPAQDARSDRHARLGLGAFATMRLMASNVFRLSARAVTMTNNEMAVALRSGRTGHHRAVEDQPRDRFIASARAFHASRSLLTFNHSRQNHRRSAAMIVRDNHGSRKTSWTSASLAANMRRSGADDRWGGVGHRPRIALLSLVFLIKGNDAHEHTILLADPMKFVRL